jgi:hypothetical protein
MKLIKREWWISRATFTTNDNGKIQFFGFLGEYNLTYNRQQARFAITKENMPIITIEA